MSNDSQGSSPRVAMKGFSNKSAQPENPAPRSCFSEQASPGCQVTVMPKPWRRGLLAWLQMSWKRVRDRFSKSEAPPAAVIAFRRQGPGVQMVSSVSGGDYSGKKPNQRVRWQETGNEAQEEG